MASQYVAQEPLGARKQLAKDTNIPRLYLPIFSFESVLNTSYSTDEVKLKIIKKILRNKLTASVV
jgi:hypothetical protein